jgi:hypothetical protein
MIAKMFSMKDYCGKDDSRCFKCNSPIIFNAKIVDEHANFIPLDLNSKRHICSGVERIFHEEKVVKKIQSMIKKANDFELASFQLTLVI